MKYTLSEIKASYDSKKGNSERYSHFFLYYLYRLVSFPLAWAALRIGLSGNQVTFISFIIVVLLLPIAAFAGAISGYLIAGLMLLFLILDCVDGNIARITGRATYAGSFLDAIVGILFWRVVVFPAIGLRISGGVILSWPVLLGLLTSALSLLVRLTSQRAQNLMAAQRKRQIDTVKEKVTFITMLKSIHDILPLFYGILVAISREILLLEIMCIYYVVAFLYSFFRIYRQMLKIKDDHK